MRACLALIILSISVTAGCRKRSEIPWSPWDNAPHEAVEEAESDAEAASTSPGETMDAEPEDQAPMVMDMQPMDKPKDEIEKKPAFMLLKFAHAENLCLEAAADGRTSLQTCTPDSEGARFLAVTALDGRLQYQNIKSRLCLASGGDRFTGFTLQMEVCASKASQFFTRLEFDKLFALRQDAENRCVYAENGAKAPGARVVMFPCANDMAQRLIP